MKLTAKLIETLDKPGRYGDDAAPGLYLFVQAHETKAGETTIRKSFVQRLTVHGKRVDIGLGTVRWGATTITEARRRALENYRIARAGGDPRVRSDARAVPTVREALEAVIEIRRAGWRDAGKSEKQWRASTAQHAGTILDRPVDRVDSAAVLGVLGPIWATRRETARRLAQRLSACFKWAIAQRHIPADPMIGVLEALPKNGNHAEHFAALPHGEVAAALATVRASRAHASTKLCFELIALTACRSNEARGARFDEIEGDVWTIPGDRTKAGKPHRVALSEGALAVLDKARELTGGKGLVFPSPTGRTMSDSTCSKLIKELGINGTIHGLRATFRTWCGETGKARELAEAALGHVVGGVEGAYQRGDALALRRELMADWAVYVSGGL